MLPLRSLLTDWWSNCLKQNEHGGSLRAWSRTVNGHLEWVHLLVASYVRWRKWQAFHSWNSKHFWSSFCKWLMVVRSSDLPLFFEVAVLVVFSNYSSRIIIKKKGRLNLTWDCFDFEWYNYHFGETVSLGHSFHLDNRLLSSSHPSFYTSFTRRWSVPARSFGLSLNFTTSRSLPFR